MYLLKPYSNNFNKRLIRTPKLYFLDTGLVCFLTGWHTSEQLQFGACKGAIFETFVVSEIIKSYYNDGIVEPPLYYYRNKEKIEIDLIIQKDGKFFPVEIKSFSDPNRNDVQAFSKAAPDFNGNLQSGCVVCTSNKLGYVDEHNLMIPVWMI